MLKELYLMPYLSFFTGGPAVLNAKSGTFMAGFAAALLCVVSIVQLYFIMGTPALPNGRSRRCRIVTVVSVLVSAFGLCFPFMPAERYIFLAGSLIQIAGLFGFEVSLALLLAMEYFPPWGFRRTFPFPLLALAAVLFPLTGAFSAPFALGVFSLVLFVFCAVLLLFSVKNSRPWGPFLFSAVLYGILGLSFVLPLGPGSFFWPAALLGYLFFERRIFPKSPKLFLFLPAGVPQAARREEPEAGQPPAAPEAKAMEGLEETEELEELEKLDEEKMAMLAAVIKGVPPVDIPDDHLSVSSFIPKEFLAILKKKSVEELKLGDHIKQEMTIFFSDIRQFTELSENLTPEESFAFINSYLARIVPEISRNGGFVDKYIGDAILALYPQHNGADMAVKTAIAIQEKIREYNNHRAKCGYRPLAMGIGIHTGTLMVGVVGTQDRMQSTVISDAVNLASRVESLTKAFRVSLAISEETFKKLEDPGSYKYRFVAKVRVKGKNEPVSIFEIFDGIDVSLQKRKIEANRHFEQGMLDYYQKHFSEALAGFRRVLEILPDDGASAFYMDNCLAKLKPLKAGGI
jgi:two-component system sensor histidine kinase ChiS